MSSSIYAMLLAAGRGTRLQQLSDERPKPLLPVCNQSLIRWAAQLCLHHGIQDLTINLHHLGELIRKELGDGSRWGARVIYSPEEEILGTGGGIKAMAALRPRGTCIVINAKIVVDIDLQEVLDSHRRSGALATLVVREDPAPEAWGAIGVDSRGQLVRLLDLRRPGTRPAKDYMFTGIHVLEPELIDAIPDGPCCVIRTAYARLFQQGAPLAGYVCQGYFQDHSTPDRYLRGNCNLLEGQARLAFSSAPLRGVDPTAMIDPEAQLIHPILIGPGAEVGAGAKVGPRVVLGEGSCVAAGVLIDHCVVWPEASVEEPSSEAIITPRIKVVVGSMAYPIALSQSSAKRSGAS